jgi:hypothetical protein
MGLYGFLFLFSTVALFKINPAGDGLSSSPAMNE